MVDVPWNRIKAKPIHYCTYIIPAGVNVTFCKSMFEIYVCTQRWKDKASQKTDFGDFFLLKFLKWNGIKLLLMFSIYQRLGKSARSVLHLHNPVFHKKLTRTLNSVWRCIVMVNLPLSCGLHVQWCTASRKELRTIKKAQQRVKVHWSNRNLISPW